LLRRFPFSFRQVGTSTGWKAQTRKETERIPCGGLTLNSIITLLEPVQGRTKG